MGQPGSANFPVTPGAFNTTHNSLFISTLIANGSSLIYSTFSVLVEACMEKYRIDLFGNVYITGNTYSNDFPKTANGFDTTYNERTIKQYKQYSFIM